MIKSINSAYNSYINCLIRKIYNNIDMRQIIREFLFNSFHIQEKKNDVLTKMEVNERNNCNKQNDVGIVERKPNM